MLIWLSLKALHQYPVTTTLVGAQLKVSLAIYVVKSFKNLIGKLLCGIVYNTMYMTILMYCNILIWGVIRDNNTIIAIFTN